MSARALVKILLSVIALYLAAWFSTYTWVMEGDMKYVAEYMRLGWIGGGETPSLIQLYAIILAATAGLVIGAVFLGFSRRRRRGARAR